MLVNFPHCVSLSITLIALDLVIRVSHLVIWSVLISNDGGGVFNSRSNETFVSQFLLNIIQQILVLFGSLLLINLLRHLHGLLLVQFLMMMLILMFVIKRYISIIVSHLIVLFLRLSLDHTNINV